MKSQWNDSDAEAMAAHYAQTGVGRDLALRVYSTRLLGSDRRLVLHGGGNTSVKTTMPDALGKETQVLCVKGSGWDMGDIEPAGLPAVRLEALRALRSLEALSDEDMVKQQRLNLLDPSSPNPSVETLLHAFLPHTFVDHTHSTAVLAISDQPDGAAICAEVYGERASLVPYVMPGFDLAKAAPAVYDASPAVEGLILLKHGIFTFGETAREAYERMIALVTLAEERIAKGTGTLIQSSAIPAQVAPLAAVAPILRGALAECSDGAEGSYRRQVLEFRTSEAIRAYVGGEDLARYSQQGVVTPDHTIRTKNRPLVVPAPAQGSLVEFKAAVESALAQYVAAYHNYFARHNGAEAERTELDPMPRVVLVPGLGLFGAGASARGAGVAADIAGNTVDVITDAERIGAFQPVPEADLFDVEYWSLEQAKLGKAAEKALARQVALITGAASGIGAATAHAFAGEGCEVVLLDRDGGGAEKIARGIGGAALGLECDVTVRHQVRAAFDRACEVFGGLDIVVSNAGAAWQGKIGEVADEVLRASFELNFFAHQSVAQNAVRVMRAQGTGGALLFNASKQAVNPGLDFGPYGLPKAATLFLSRQYALEYGEDGIRSNAVNADRVNTGIFADGFLEERAQKRGLTPEEYLRSGNLLKREVKPEDVARAFVDLALSPKTTGAVLTVDGGNIAAALR